MHIKNFLTFAIMVTLAWQAQAQTYDTNNEVVETFAGYGIPGYVDGQGLLTAFSNPSQVVSDTASNLYVWDSGNARIRKITPDGTVSTFAGGGTSFEGYGTNVSLSWGSGGSLAIDHANTLWLVLVNGYYGYTYLVTIGPDAHVSLANGGLPNLGTGSGLCFDSANNLYYSGGNRIYRYTPGTAAVQAFAGSGIAADFDGQGPLFSAFNNPGALACDQADNIYVWDSGNTLIRRIDQSQNVTTIAGNNQYYYGTVDGAGTNATFNGGIASMCADNQGNIYLVCGSCIRKMNAQTNVVTLAGTFYQYSPAYANGSGAQACFANAAGGCFSQGMFFVADTGNNRIRSISFNQQSQVVPPAGLQLKTYAGLQITGTIGRSYQILSSANLNTWSPVATVLLTSSPLLWMDQNPVSGNKYYRALLLP